MRWNPSLPSFITVQAGFSEHYLDPFLITTTFHQVSFGNEFLLTKALFYDYLAEPRLRDKMETHWLGRKAMVLSQLHHLPLSTVSHLGCWAHHFLTDGGLCDNPQLPQKTERGLNNMLVRDLANTWCNTGYSVIITFWESQNSPETPSRFKDKWFPKKA